MNRSALFLLVPLLAGCNVHSKHSADGDENVVINADDSGHIAFNVPFAQGQVKVPGAMMHSGDFDIDGVKLIPGSSVTGFNLNAGDHGSTVNIAFSAPVPPDQGARLFPRPVQGEGRPGFGQRRRCHRNVEGRQPVRDPSDGRRKRDEGRDRGPRQGLSGRSPS